MASGRPSSTVHSRSTASRVTGSAAGSKSGRTAVARSVNSRTAGEARVAARSVSGPGRARVGTGRSASPVMPSASRLAAGTRSRRRTGQRAFGRRRGLGDDVLAVVQDEQHRAPVQGSGDPCHRVGAGAGAGRSGAPGVVAAPGPPLGSSPPSRSPSAPSTACGRSAPPVSPASSTKVASCGCRTAASTARRVLPAPPGPVRVTSRCRANCSPIRSSSASRPTRLVQLGGQVMTWGVRGGLGAGGRCSTWTCPVGAVSRGTSAGGSGLRSGWPGGSGSRSVWRWDTDARATSR